MNIQEMAKIINQNKGRLYLVGGAVRDMLLNKENHDEDYCVTGLTEDKFTSLFKEAILRGKSFGVFDIEHKEFALARTEEKVGKGHKEFEVKTGEHIEIEEDLARRDITINSMAQDILTGELIDPYGGKQDLENKIIRATTEKFAEDPLRVYRVARLASQLNFTVEKNTLELMHNLKKELLALSKERVFCEFRKALETQKPSVFFEVLKNAMVLDVHFKEVFDLIGSLQPEEYHPEGDSYNHTMIVVDESTKLTDKVEVRYSALVHDLGKGVTPKSEYPHHYGHDKNGVLPVRELSKRLEVPTLWEKCGKVSAEEHMRAYFFSKMKPDKQVKLIEKLDRSLLGLDGMKVVVTADKCSTRDCEEITFVELGKEMLNSINGDFIKDKYGTIQGEQFKEKLTKERIIWLKNKQKH